MTKEELEEFVDSVDLNKDGVSDKKQIKDYFINAWKWIKTHKVTVALTVCLILALLALTKVMLKQPSTQPTITKIQSAISQSISKPKGNLLTIDLDSFKVITVGEKTSRVKKGLELSNVYFGSEWNEKGSKLPEGISIFIRIFEDQQNLKYTKKAFNDYIERETKNAALLSKEPIKK